MIKYKRGNNKSRQESGSSGCRAKYTDSRYIFEEAVEPGKRRAIFFTCCSKDAVKRGRERSQRSTSLAQGTRYFDSNDL